MEAWFPFWYAHLPPLMIVQERLEEEGWQRVFFHLPRLNKKHKER